MTLFFSLMGGLLIAVALQLVTANLGIAIGLTLLDWRPKERLVNRSGSAEHAGTASSSQLPSANGTGQKASADTDFSLPVTHLLGFSVAAGLSIVLFVASLLSVEFGQIIAPRRGVIFGIVLWATYWLLFIWLSSTTVAIAANSLLGTAIAGGQRLLAAITQTLTSADSPATPASDQSSLLKELSAEISKIASVQQELPGLLANQKETLIAEICDRTQLSTPEVQNIIEAIAPNANSEKQSENNDNQQDSPTEAKAPAKHTSATAIVETSPSAASALSSLPATVVSQLDLPSWQSILKRALTQVDLSDLAVETLLQQLPQNIQPSWHVATLRENSATLTEKSPTEANKTDQTADQTTDHGAAIASIQSKLISYCRYTSLDHLTPQHLADKIDAQRQQHGLSAQEWRQYSLDIAAIESVLDRRRKLSEKRKQQLVETLHQSWPLPSEPAPSPSQKEAVSGIRAIAHQANQTLESHLEAIDWSQVSLEDIKPEIILLLNQLEAGTLQSLDWAALTHRIRLPTTAKKDFINWLQATLTDKLSSARPAAIEASQSLSQQLTTTFSERITQLLSHPEKSALQPAKLTKQLTQIVVSTLSAVPYPTELISTSDVSGLWQQLWNRDTWQRALEKRKDLTAEEIQQILTWGETAWQGEAQQIGEWMQAIRTEAQKLLSLPDISTMETMETARQHVVSQVANQIAKVQAQLSEQAIAAQTEIQQQAEAARKQVAIAAWWIFIALISSGSAAAGAGWLAAMY
ncbi:MAG: hypothetical protein AAFP07_11250 [Cyanobacteria bacterium J06606_4]